jgi:hypothetical protein
LYTSPNIITAIKSRRIGWAGHVACLDEIINAYTILIGKYEGKKPLGRPRCRWEDNRLFKWISRKQGGKMWTGFTSDGLL